MIKSDVVLFSHYSPVVCSISYTLGFSKYPAFHCSRLSSVRMSLFSPIISLAELLWLRKKKGSMFQSGLFCTAVLVK